MSRIGNVPSGSREAGIFHSTSTIETSPASHGTGTAYCGRVVYTYSSGRHNYYKISTGIGKTDTLDAGFVVVEAECRAYSSSMIDRATCNYDLSSGQCPRGWGNRLAYENFQPGCCDGTYYPNAKPASSTSQFTGSCNGSRVP